MAKYYIGLMSGTSIDSIDAVLVDADKDYAIVASHTIDWNEDVQAELHALCAADEQYDTLETVAEMNNVIAHYESKAVLELIAKAGINATDVIAIGSHGQTVRHRPRLGYSVQLDNGPLLAAITNIDAIVNFRMADVALGGDGAPLTPAFHQRLFASPDSYRFVLNLGGIANITVLSPEGEILTAFDTGPANTLMDYVCRTYLNQECDRNGEHAAAGTVDEDMLALLMSHPYLRRDFPKSTGREDFNAETISPLTDTLPDNTKSALYEKTVNTILATLCEFTALSIREALDRVCVRFNILQTPKELVVCGGGAYNTHLMKRLSTLSAACNMKLVSCDDINIDAKFLEAQAFAYFAACFVERNPLNLTAATRAQTSTILGCLCPAPQGYYLRSARKEELSAL